MMEALQIIGAISGITVVPMFAWVVTVERRLSRIEGFCKARCEISKEQGKVMARAAL